MPRDRGRSMPTHMSSHARWPPRWRAAGANAVKAVGCGDGGRGAECLCRHAPAGPPCRNETPMGFCLFGNVAIAAKHALENHGLARVAVVDFDVHHGNGTQDLLVG